LDDFTVRTFGIFQTWLYSGTLTLPDDSDAYLDPEREHLNKCSECGHIRSIESNGAPTEVDWTDDLLDIYIPAGKNNFHLLCRETMITYDHLSAFSRNRLLLIFFVKCLQIMRDWQTTLHSADTWLRVTNIGGIQEDPIANTS
jgi:hypothetical protein